MKRRSKMALVALVIFVAAVTRVLLWSNEPRYHGQKLSEWVVSLGLAKNGMAPVEDQKEAILAIGTNALPFLVQWITYPVDPPNLRLFGIGVAVPTTRSRAELKEGTLAAFKALGPRAVPALPDLFQLLKATNTTVVDQASEAIVVITRNPETSAASLMPALKECLKSPDPEVSITAAHVLADVADRKQADLVVPAFAQAAQSANKHVRFSAVYGLGKLGPYARSAVPALARALVDPELSVRVAATNSVMQVAPELILTK